MNKLTPAFLLLLLLPAACSDPVAEKPYNLISRNDMISILADIHLAEALYQTKRFSNKELNKYSESDYYYSVLKKHKVADSTFELSLIFYSSKPKEFEKIYTRVINRLNEMEQELTKKNQQPVDIDNSGPK